MYHKEEEEEKVEERAARRWKRIYNKPYIFLSTQH
jgi:hypothetical protein